MAPQPTRPSVNADMTGISKWWAELGKALSDDYSNRKTLIADDEDIICEVLTHIFDQRIKCGHETVATGDELLARLEQAQFDVVITDMIMPGTHGLELIAKIRAAQPDTDIIVMTGFPQAFPYVEVIGAGASDFIAKPHQPGEIEAKLVRLFRERELRERLYLSEEKYRRLFDLSMSGNVLLDPVTLTIVDVNKAFCGLTGLDHESLVGANLFEVVDDSEHLRFKQAFKIFAAAGQGTVGDVTFKGAGGQRRFMDISATFIAVPQDTIVLLNFTDVTEKREMENEFVQAAQTDATTGLLNKRTFTARLAAVVPRAHRSKQCLSLMFIDLDDFKRCNDTHGHQVGDRVLKKVGEIIRGGVRSGDEGFRYGGDEFAVTLPGAASEAAADVAERMRSSFEEGQRFGTTMSVGIASLQPDMKSEELVKAADDALYRAKALGKNSIFVA